MAMRHPLVFLLVILLMLNIARDSYGIPARCQPQAFEN
jgi:hypothetical protein